jgi:hypothetical protein
MDELDRVINFTILRDIRQITKQNEIFTMKTHRETLENHEEILARLSKLENDPLHRVQPSHDSNLAEGSRISDVNDEQKVQATPYSDLEENLSVASDVNNDEGVRDELVLDAQPAGVSISEGL